MIVLLYSIFAILCGVVEAVLYSRRGAEAFTRNEHVEMMLQRISVALLVLAAAWLHQLTGSMVYVAFELVPAALLFPACHDEAYNFTRLWQKHSERYAGMPTIPGSLNPDRAGLRASWIEYRYGYQSPTTTARNDFNGTQRTWLAGAGLLIWAIGALILL